DIECHYFARREPRQFFAPELIVSDALRAQNELYAASRCVERWRALLPALAVHVTPAADHFAMMDDPDSLAVIAGVCRRLYPECHEVAGPTPPIQMLAGHAGR